MIALSDITVDAGINPRAHGLNKNHVAELAAWLEANPKADLPPVILYGKILSEGFHRCSAYESAGRTKIPCEVRNGGRVEAILNAVASNQKHGLKRTNEDKRLAVRLALDAAPDWADNRIAEHVGVDHKFVGNIRSELAASEVEINWDGPNYDEPEQPTKRGPKPRKTDHAKAAARLLLKDHTRTDDDVAKEVGCNAKTVALARKGLMNKGRIPDLAPEPKKEAVKEPEEPPADTLESWIGELNRLCRVIDALKKEVEKVVDSHPLGKKFVHTDSITQILGTARSTIWQSRPTEECNCVRRDGKIHKDCRACNATGKCAIGRVLKGSK